ncbi:type III restriction endonuclease subunit M [Mycoplasma sp. 'Moose RK']|uniref:type III restriction endonuclease subunit M n=1 Tax=Mycoplasma sp. 'Moose RK' TaxID=2780095 RepID=UPI0018C2CE8A|nr:type III restriction endonuclease subunit M [Mycoplasma sp. 'Moose RK']MBG0730847.1 type III restriction endonuclease subunit M [Mycoplasma sp. 'Moose RK']
MNKNKSNEEILTNFFKILDEVSQNELNSEQKQICKQILEFSAEKNLDLQSIFGFLLQRVKVGFTFDETPIADSKTIAILEKDENFSFENENNFPKNHLIIGENYDALKNLLAIEREREREKIATKMQ